MATEARERPAARRAGSRGPRVLRFLYGGGLFAIGACLGVVIGSVSETPRLLLERLRGPVETIDVAAPVPEAEPERAATPLKTFGELQEGKPPAPPAKRPEPPPPVATAPPAPKPTPAPAPEAAKPAAPAASSPPAVVPAPALTGRAVVQVASQIEKKAAEDMAAKLRAQGFDAYVSKPSAQNGRFRVRVRPEGDESPAALAKRLKGVGYDTWATSE